MNIRYFAWLRTKVGKAEEEVSPPSEVRTVGDLQTWLAAERPGFAEALGRPGVVRTAVNQDYA
ncbi:MAG: MoaD/ThiS family protein, partial [Geminicoccaceae bacterium]